MSDVLRGSAVFVQSGEPTAATNAALAGAAQEAAKSESIDKLLGAYRGILGLLQEELFDLRKERAEDLENLKRTPAAALGSGRYGVASSADLERAIEVLKAHNVRFCFCIGGRDAMQAAEGVARLAAGQGHELRVIGIPAAADNDLAGTDHCPGYGSAVKFNAAQVMAAGRYAEALQAGDACAVQEFAGGGAGWVAAGTALARRAPEDAPHLIYVPERPVALEQVARDVRECLGRFQRCFIAVGEGLKFEGGAAAAEALGAFIEKELGVRCRAGRSGGEQRAAMHFASLTDVQEAVEVGAVAVRKAVKGQSGVMITLVRESGPVYRCSAGTAALAEAAGGRKPLPKEYLNAEGNGVTDALKEYVRPLLRGEAPINVGPDGLPLFVRLQKRFVPRKLAQWAPPAKP